MSCNELGRRQRRVPHRTAPEGGTHATHRLVIVAKRARGEVLLLLLQLEDPRLDAVLNDEPRDDDRAVLAEAVDPCARCGAKSVSSGRTPARCGPRTCGWDLKLLEVDSRSIACS